ncbi:alpha/beta hydrolase [Acetobacterium sp. MES1]|uniref:alpha/beta fold hydrolase n=1 Tax=Acetobacterium sp. MES1 TaxID=1899015 RepID=UPI00257B7625|nr:alpha/beta hydrolase [Acetobacterium sp. MES1]
MLEKIITSPRGTVFYWIARHQDPQATCLVFTHGLTANHRMFDHQVASFRKHYTVISWDLPLHGASRPYTDFSFHHAAADLDAILNHEKIPAAVLIGQSLGGYACQQYALDFPDKVLAFVGVDTSPFGPSYYSRSDRFWVRQVEWLSRCYPHDKLVTAIAKGATHTKRGFDNMMAMLAPYGKAELCRIMGTAYTSFLRENCDTAFDFPVLLTLGEYDRFGKVPQYNWAWTAKTGYPLKIIPGAGHNANVDNPVVFNAVVEDFLDSHQLL